MAVLLRTHAGWMGAAGLHREGGAEGFASGIAAHVSRLKRR